MNQHQIDKTLKWGIVFSIVWLMGLGSIFAVVCGLRARKAINGSGGSLVGRGKVWWCLVVGGLGIAFWLALSIAVVLPLLIR